MADTLKLTLASRRSSLRKLALLVMGLSGYATLSARDRPDRGAASGIVYHVADGDSFSLTLNDGRRISVRIVGIDAPELGQPFADVARQFLRNLIEGRAVEITTVKIDPFGRAVATVMLNGQDVGLILVRAGLAWHFKRFESEQSRDDRLAYAQAERVARQDAIGLWADQTPQAPWEYRDRQRQQGRQ